MGSREELRILMQKRNYSVAFVAKATGLGKSTISMWLSNTYNGKNDKIADVINNFIQREKESNNNEEIPFVEISIVKYIFEIGRLCHTKGKIGVCAGVAGLGKTVATKKYVQEYVDSILIESDSGYSAKSLLLEIHDSLGLSGKGSVYKLMKEVIVKLNNSNRLLIIDEAENLPYRALEITRRIHDKTGIGVLLVGRNVLFDNLIGFNNEYEQLYSRVKYHKLIGKLTPGDVIKIVESVGQDPSLADAYFQYSNGNTRKLEHLITHSNSIARVNGKAEVDVAVIKHASKLLMA